MSACDVVARCIAVVLSCAYYGLCASERLGLDSFCNYIDVLTVLSLSWRENEICSGGTRPPSVMSSCMFKLLWRMRSLIVVSVYPCSINACLHVTVTASFICGGCP